MKVLIIEPDQSLLDELVFEFCKDGYETLTASSGESGVALAQVARPDIIISEVTLPGMTGLDVCRQIRLDNSVPLIFLTHRWTDTERIVGLEVGANDYLVKPCSTAELIIRVRNMLNCCQQPAWEASEIYEFDGVVINPKQYDVIVRGQKIDITKREFKLLLLLVQNPSTVVRRDTIIDRIWAKKRCPADVSEFSTLSVHMSSLRKKIERDPANPRHIITVHGIGYRFDP